MVYEQIGYTVMKLKTHEYSILLFMVITTLLGKFLGLFRDMMIASAYGTSVSADAFFVASRIPNSFFDFALSAAIASTFIPIFNRIMKKNGKEESFEYTNRFMSFVLLVAFLVTGLLILFSKQVVGIFGPGLTDEGAALAIHLTKLMAPIVIFASVTYTYTGLMQSFDHFHMPAAVSIFSNALVIVYLLTLQKQFGLHGLAIAFTLGWFVQSLIQMPMMAKEGYRLKPTLKLRTPDMRDTLQMSLPILLTSWAQPITALVTTSLASFTGGGVSMMEYATRVYIIISGVLIYSITNYVFPKLSKAFSGNEQETFRRTISNSIIFFTYFAVPIIALVIAFRADIIDILFGRGAMTSDITSSIGDLLGILMLGLYAMGIKEIYSRVYFSMGDTKTPMKITLLSIAISVPTSFALYPLFDLKGLAIASTLSVIFMALLMANHMRRRLTMTHPIAVSIKVLCVDAILFYALHTLYGSIEANGLLLQIALISGLSILFLALHALLLFVLKQGIPKIN